MYHGCTLQHTVVKDATVSVYISRADGIVREGDIQPGKAAIVRHVGNVTLQ